MEVPKSTNRERTESESVYYKHLAQETLNQRLRGEEDNATSRDTPTYGRTGEEIMLPQETLRPTAGQEKR